MERARRAGILFRSHPSSRKNDQVQRLRQICDQCCDVGTAAAAATTTPATTTTAAPPPTATAPPPHPHRPPAPRAGILFRSHPSSRKNDQVQRLRQICDQCCDVGTAAAAATTTTATTTTAATTTTTTAATTTTTATTAAATATAAAATARTH